MTKPKAKKHDNREKGTSPQWWFLSYRVPRTSPITPTPTQSLFCTEASSLFSKSPIREASKSWLSLSEILNEYITLKEQKLLLDHKKIRVKTFHNGLQNSMNIY